MNARDVLGLFMLVLGVVACLLGLGAGLRDMPLGWVGLLAGIAILAVSYKMSRPQIAEGTEDTTEAAE